MARRSLWVLVVALLMIAPALAGCAQLPGFGGDGADDGADDSDDGQDGDDGDEPVTLTVTIDNVSGLVETGETIDVTWSVGTGSGNETEIPHTAVHWGNASVADPQSPADYGNTSGAQEPATVPGTFTTNFTLDEPATIYLRAHARNPAGTDFWSDEAEVTVQETWDPTIHTIEIGNNTPGIQADYDPSGLEIDVGDGIRWINRDSLGLEHTATSQDGAPESFDTGSLAPDEESEVFYFNTTGTYEYFCNNHGEDNMSDEFTVS